MTRNNFQAKLVSFRNSSKDYSIMTQDELDEYIDGQGMTMGGM